MSLLVTVCYEPDGSPSLRDRKLSMKVCFIWEACPALCKKMGVARPPK